MTGDKGDIRDVTHRDEIALSTYRLDLPAPLLESAVIPKSDLIVLYNVSLAIRSFGRHWTVSATISPSKCQAHRPFLRRALPGFD